MVKGRRFYLCKMNLKLLLIGLLFSACESGTGTPSGDSTARDIVILNTPKMKIEIWSDVQCPFCYIGKRKFEEALQQFPERERVEIVWRSFQLDPNLEPQPGKSIYAYLAEAKGQSIEWSQQMHQQVTEMAREAGLTYNFDRAVIANSFDAHRLIQLAKTKNLGDEAEERIFKAYFTEGEDIGNHATLVKLGTEIGLGKEEVEKMLASAEYAEAVRQDIEEGAKLGLRGVPFFVMDRKYGVSGAQAPEVFLQTIEKAFAEWEKENRPVKLQTIDGKSCTPQGECE